MREGEEYSHMGGRGGKRNQGYDYKLCSLSGRLD